MKSNIEWIPARELLSSHRIDLMAKYTYVEHFCCNYDTEWAIELYSKHIEAFSGGTYKEPGNDKKNTLKAYIDIFNQLIVSISQNFDEKKSTIPVSFEGVIGDGAHRTSIMAYLNKKIPCQKVMRNVNYDASFFKEMFLDEYYLDYMVTKYVELKDGGVYVLCLWPSAVTNKGAMIKTKDLIEKKSQIIYEKEIEISYNGLRNLMIQIYFGQDWIGTPENHFKGIEGKVAPCFHKNRKMQVYVIESKNFDRKLEIVALKNEIRSLYQMGNHSVHANDTKEEAERLVHLLLNENSRELLNKGKINFDATCLNRILRFQNMLNERGLDKSSFILDSSTIMALYGMRKVGDLDYVTVFKEELLGFGVEKVDNNEQYLKYHNKTASGLIMNPYNYAYIFDMKVITPKVLKNFKKNKNSIKDQEDIKLIDRFISEKKSINQEWQYILISWKRMNRNSRSRIRDILHKHNIYIFTKLWHLFRGKGFK